MPSTSTDRARRSRARGRPALHGRRPTRDPTPSCRPRVLVPRRRRRRRSATREPWPGSGALAIPPAWTDVWICPDPNGHLQATGSRRRAVASSTATTPRWQRPARTDEVRSDARVRRGPAPRSGADATRDLARRGLPREKVLAAVVRLLELTLIRVGNDEYARLNRSFGLTTLRDRHAKVDGRGPSASGSAASPGASTRWGSATAGSPRSSGAARTCPARSSSSTSTRTARSATSPPRTSTPTCARSSGGDFTAKDFRTWAGTVLAYRALRALAPADSDRDARRAVVAAMESTADHLGNTPAVARGSYVHPAVIDAYLDGSIGGALVEAADSAVGLPPGTTCEEETEVIRLLEARRRLDARQAGGSRRRAKGRRPR